MPIYVRRSNNLIDSTKGLRNTDVLNSYKISIIENIERGWQFLLLVTSF